MASDHDTAYKQLFAHPEMVRDLLRGYMPGDLLSQLDLATLERVNGSYAEGEGTQRHSDMVWKARLDGQWLYFYVLLEFQSEPDRWMALRMFVYVGLLYQDLIKRHELAADGLLPPVLPIVLYDGIRPWNASLSLGELIAAAPDGLEEYQPEMRYLLIERRHAYDGPIEDNLILLLFRAAETRSEDDYRMVLRQLVLWLGMERNAMLRNSAELWLRSRLPGPSELPSMNSGDQQPGGYAMLPTVEEAVEYWKYGERLGEAQGLLMRALTKRFGEAGAAMFNDVCDADLEAVRRWHDRFAEQKSLPEIFSEDS